MLDFDRSLDVHLSSRVHTILFIGLFPIGVLGAAILDDVTSHTRTNSDASKERIFRVVPTRTARAHTHNGLV